ncbi:MAG TPA: ABC transporter ATP-binding protein [Beijerinckiaceae bacterium]|nr:ABC transporter ATP-binding protein [Beijerinckiaceae bacterium]
MSEPLAATIPLAGPAPGAASRAPVLEARNLGLHLRQSGRELKIVDDISFTIAPGEFFALIGESGSGKTMIARAVMRLLPSRKLRIAGRLAIEGIDVATAPEREMEKLRGRRVSMIFQEPMSSLNPIMTVQEQLDEALCVHGLYTRAERRERIAQILADVRFADPRQVAAMYPHELSGGMRQRAMIAMALCNDPTLLIADEPTTALDVTIQREIMEILFRLRERYNLSVLFISHDLALVYRYADTIGVLYGGVLMEQGPIRQVIETPTHPYTAALLACMPRYRAAGERQAGIEGNVPRVDDWFTGCRFAPRCPRRQEVCTHGEVALAPVRPGQAARCLFPLT